jgi:hypothetical protein
MFPHRGFFFAHTGQKGRKAIINSLPISEAKEKRLSEAKEKKQAEVRLFFRFHLRNIS